MSPTQERMLEPRGDVWETAGPVLFLTSLASPFGGAVQAREGCVPERDLGVELALMVSTYRRKLGSFPPGSGPDSQHTLQDSAGLRCLSRALGTGRTHTSSLEAREGSHVGHAGVSTFADSAKVVLALPKVGPQAQRGMATHFSPARRQLHRTFLGCLRKASMILLFKQTFHMKSGNRGHLQVRLYRQGRAPHFPQPAPPRLSSLRSLKALGFPFTEQRSLERKSWKGGGSLMPANGNLQWR